MGAAVLVLAVLLTLTEGPFVAGARARGRDALGGGGAVRRPARGLRARGGAAGVRLSPRPRPASRVPDRVVVLDRQSPDRGRAGTSAFSSRSSGRALTPDAPARESRLGRQPGLSGAPGGDRLARRPLPLRDADQPRRARPGRRPGGALPRSSWRTGRRGARGPATFPLPSPRGGRETWRWISCLESAKPPVLQGERGLSRKGPEPGNASYYYSLTRHARARHHPARHRAARGGGARVDGPRVEHRRAGQGPGGLGLVRAAARGRARADVLPAPPAGRHRGSLQRRRGGGRARRHAGADARRRAPRGHRRLAQPAERGRVSRRLAAHRHRRAASS